MWPFLLFGGLFAGAATLGRAHRPALVVWMAFLVMTILFVGLRHHVGMDWNNYLRMIYAVERADSLGRLFNIAEPFYAALLWIGVWTGGGMYVVNLIAATIGMIGVFAFARRTPEPWLGLMAALPIFILVVSMSANRQALAAGLLMLLIANWARFGLIGRSVFIVLCAGFHASAIFFLIFVAIDLKLPKAARYAGIAMFGILAVYFLQQSGFGQYYDDAYGSGQSEQVQSGGALIHVALNAVPAAFYFLFPAHRKLLFPTPLLRNMAFAGMLTVLLVPFASAAAGRISIYWFPVSIYVWAAVPQMVDTRFRRPLRLAISALMLAVLAAWLQFANSSIGHIPYHNAMLVEEWELEIGVLP